MLSDFTALLVLETEWDYRRFGIQRQALADILVIGPGGALELAHRDDLVVPAAAGPPSPGKWADLDDDDEAEPGITREAPKHSAAGDKGWGASCKSSKHCKLGLLCVGGACVEPENAPPGSADPRKPPYSGRMAVVFELLQRQAADQAVIEALRWRNDNPGDVMALLALGEALEARGSIGLAARAYGSIIDLYPSRADMLRMAGERLERLGMVGQRLAVDTLARAVRQRPFHLTGHRLLGYALLRQGYFEAAFYAIERGLRLNYPRGRFEGGKRVLLEDLGLIAAAWLRRAPKDCHPDIRARVEAAGATIETQPSLRFVLVWETDATDMDLHIYDGKGGHALSNLRLKSGGKFYGDVTDGYGPECFTIRGAPRAFPYSVGVHYFDRGSMGYGMGKVEIIWHDGKGGLQLDQRPFVVMNEHSYIDLGAFRPAHTAGQRCDPDL